MKTKAPHVPQGPGPAPHADRGGRPHSPVVKTPTATPSASRQAFPPAGNQAAQRSAPTRTDDPEAVRARLGAGQVLDQTVRSRMGSVFGADFSNVRLHTDASADLAAQALGAQAFTVGEDMAFAAGRYQPGTLVGDALIAHELAHVLQQRRDPAGDKESLVPESAVELDADSATTAAVGSLWAGARGLQTGIQPVDQPALRSGPRLSRCGKDKPEALPRKSVTVNPTKMHGSSYNIAVGFTYANDKVYKQANVEVKKGKEEPQDETKSKAILGDDLILHEFSDPKAPTDEEKALLKVNQSAGALTAYFVKGMSDGSTGENFRPGHGTGLLGFVVSDDGNAPTFSHELGHVLLDDGGHDVPDDTYLMFASKKADKYKLTPEQMTKIRSSPFVT